MLAFLASVCANRVAATAAPLATIAENIDLVKPPNTASGANDVQALRIF
jgi:hypothetical protein